MSLIVHRICDICGKEFDDDSLNWWCRIDHLRIHKWQSNICKNLETEDLTIDLCPKHTSELLDIIKGGKSL